MIRNMPSPSRKFWKRNPHGQLLSMCWDFNLMETQGSIPYGSLRTVVPILEQNWKSGVGKESIEKRVSPLKNFEPILQNWDMRSLLSQLEKDYYPRATICCERSQKISPSIKTNLYCQLSVILPSTRNVNKKSNSMQGISHRMATLHRSQGLI